MLLIIMSLMPVFGLSSVYFGHFRILLTSPVFQHTPHTSAPVSPRAHIQSFPIMQACLCILALLFVIRTNTLSISFDVFNI